MTNHRISEPGGFLFKKSFLVILVAFWAVLFLWEAASAELLEDIKSDLTRVSGYILTEEAGQYVVDFKKDQGVIAGDLLLVAGEGRELTHPVTGEIVGRLKGEKGFLKLTYVGSDFSFARLVEGEGFKRGDRVIRYGEMPAVFQDHTGKGEALFARLRETLSGLEWKDYVVLEDEKSQEKVVSGLNFLLYHDRLEIRGPGSELIHRYPLEEDASDSHAFSQVRSKAHTSRDQGETPVLNLHGRVEGRMVQSDFIWHENRVLTAATDGSKIRIYAPQEGTESIFQADTVLPGQILWVSWWKPKGNDRLYLAVTSMVEEDQGSTVGTSKKINGSIFHWTKEKLIPVHRGLRFMMAAFDRDGNATPETLLGQRFDRDNFFGKVQELQFKDDRIEGVSPSFFIPRGFPVFGSTFVDLSGDGKPEVAFIRNQTLFIYSEDGLLYESSNKMGGSQNCFTYDLNPGMANAIFHTVSLETAPVGIDIDDDGKLELLAITSEASSFSFSGRGPNVRESRLSVLDFVDGTFIRSQVGSSLEQGIQGLGVVRGKVWLVNTSGSPKKRASLFYTIP
jgi:hypothetical protein